MTSPDTQPGVDRPERASVLTVLRDQRKIIVLAVVLTFVLPRVHRPRLPAREVG